ncbi:MAG: glycosyltransferase [Pseudomonadota bacterium]
MTTQHSFDRDELLGPWPALPEDTAMAVLKAEVARRRPKTIFEIAVRREAVTPGFCRDLASTVICLGKDRAVQSPTAAANEAVLILHRVENSKDFDFSAYYGTVDLVVLDAASREADLLRESMHAFRMIKPDGRIAWLRPQILDEARRRGFARMEARFLLHHADRAGLTLYGFASVDPAASGSDTAQEASIALSVVIPTRNGADRLGAALESALHQTLAADVYEVVVVDNGSTDRTSDLVKDWIRRVGDRVRYICETAPGLANARHAGARAAKGEILCYLDDDAVAAPGWLEAIRDAFKAVDVALVGGRILPRFHGTPPPWLQRFWYTTPSGKSMGVLSLLDFGDRERDIDPDFVWGCNYAVRKEVLMRAGGFHPDALPRDLIRYRGDGEVGLSRKIRKLGYRARYHPGATVEHCISATRLTPGYFCRRQFNEGISASFTRIRKQGPPRNCDFSADLLEGMESYMAALFDPQAVESMAAPADLEEAMALAHEYGRLYHIHQAVSDAEFLSHVCRPDYMTPAVMTPPAGFGAAKGEGGLLPSGAMGRRAAENYRAGLWLAENGLHRLALKMLSLAEQGDVKPAGTDYVRAVSFMEIGDIAGAESALDREPWESHVRPHADALYGRIHRIYGEQRMALLTNPPKGCEVELDRLPLTLANAVIYITDQCNSRCITCNAWKNTAEKSLETDHWKRALSRIRDAGISAVEFVGGEPLLRPDLTELIAEARRLGFTSILVSTNGFLLDEARQERLLAAGANSFHISLDGFGGIYHTIRGRDWSERVEKTIRRLAWTGVDLLVLTTLTRKNLDELLPIVSFVQDVGARWFPNILENGKYLFKGIDTRDLIIADPSDVARLVASLETLLARFSQFMAMGRPDIEYIRQYLLHPELEKRIPCTLGFEAIYFDPRGNLFPACMSLKPVGNLLEDDLTALIGSERMRRRLRAMVERRCPGCTCGYSQRAQYMDRMRPRP